MLRACFGLIVVFLSQIVVAQDRFALVIGNGKYTGAAELKNPPNDAAAVAAALEKLDFQVNKQVDTNLDAMEKAVLAFRKSLTKKSLALFFYAGHGLQVKGENFLVPTDAKVEEESQVKRKCFPVEELLTELDSSEAALKVVILDSCRDNPLTRSWSRSSGSGLASIAQVPDGTIIAFSTAPGKTALDGRGVNSPFTKHLVASLERRPSEGLEVFQALRSTGQAVSEEIGQRPWMNFDTSLKDFYLWRDAAIAAVPKPLPKPTPTPAAEESLPLSRGWKRIDHPHDSKFTAAENSVGMKFVVIPPGEFSMGTKADESGWPDERPQHRVRISRAMYFGMYEVTLGQFLTFYHAAKHKTDAEKDGKGGSGFTGDKRIGYEQRPEFVPWTTGFKQTNNHPVVNVSWNDAQAFCRWLSDKEGVTYRLPTEAEWEYCCRAGSTTRYESGNDKLELAKVANIPDSFDLGHTTYEHSAPVGSFRPNRFGLYDLHGNACEWCQDSYQEDIYAARSGLTTDPKGPAGEKSYRVQRGGSWIVSSSSDDRCADRNWEAPEHRSVASGFRVMLITSP